MWYVRDVLYAVLYVRVNCFVARECAVLRRYINVCNSHVFSVVNMYRDHLKLYVMCNNSRRYVIVVNVMLSLMSVMSPPLSCATHWCAWWEFLL